MAGLAARKCLALPRRTVGGRRARGGPQRPGLCVLWLILTLMPGLCRGAWGGEADTPWHLPEWQHRQTVRLIMRDPGSRINTGLIEFEARPPLVAEDGRDVRVLDGNGRPVQFEWIGEPGKPTREPFAGDGPTRLHFEVTHPATERYFVYSGNPEADAADGAWEKVIGSLTLETRGHPTHTAAAHYQQMLDLLAKSKWRYGKGERRNINDPENPFSRQQEAFLSIYRGLIYCPADGTYRFATNSDDSSFLLINSKLVVQWPGGHNPKNEFEHYGDINVKRGVHRIEYYHVQSGGGTLARAGWRPPGAEKIVTIPPEAFVRELRTETVAVEQRDKPLSAFFKAVEEDAVRFGSSGPVFVKVAFKDLSRSAFRKIAAREWDFGDGTVSREPEPHHLFVGGRPYRVTLRCVDELGFESTWTRTLNLDPADARRADVAMEVSAPNLVLPSEPVRVRLRCKNAGPMALGMTLVSETRASSGELIERSREPIVLPARVWESWERDVGGAEGSVLETGEIAFHLEYKDTTVLSRRVVVRGASDPGLTLRLEQEHVVDENGRRTVLRLSDRSYKARGASFTEKLSRGDAARILVVDGSLASSGEQSYLDHVASALQRLYPSARAHVLRIEPKDAGTRSYTTMRSVVQVPSAVEEKHPDLVIVAGSLRDIVRFTPVERFERMLHVLVDRLEAECGAEVLLVTPPPAIANPGLGQAYAIAVKRVGLRRGLPVADVYSAFMSAGRGASKADRGWREFYRDPDSLMPLYHLAPTGRGQYLIAETILDVLLSRRVRWRWGRPALETRRGE